MRSKYENFVYGEKGILAEAITFVIFSGCYIYGDLFDIGWNGICLYDKRKVNGKTFIVVVCHLIDIYCSFTSFIICLKSGQIVTPTEWFV